jgi:hypothetical protein
MEAYVIVMDYYNVVYILVCTSAGEYIHAGISVQIPQTPEVSCTFSSAHIMDYAVSHECGERSV